MLRRKRPASLVILDLNGTLLATDYDGGTYGKTGLHADFREGRKDVYVRPFLHTFLQYLFAWYDVAVWTCNSRRYAEPIVQRVFGDELSRRLVFLWCREECMREPQLSAATGAKMRLIKQLPEVWSKYPMYQPAQVVLVDDNPRKAGVYSREHLVAVDTFTPSNTTLPDQELLSLLSRLAARLRQSFSGKALQPSNSDAAAQAPPS